MTTFHCFACYLHATLYTKIAIRSPFGRPTGHRDVPLLSGLVQEVLLDELRLEVNDLEVIDAVRLHQDGLGQRRRGRLDLHRALLQAQALREGLRKLEHPGGEALITAKAQEDLRFTSFFGPSSLF